MGRWLGIAGLVLVLDQLTKVLAERHLALHDPVPVLPLFNLTLVYNRGAAFSFLNTAGGWQRWLFAGVALAVSAYIVYWLRSIPRGQLWLPTALSLVLGGAVGNLIDRLRLGVVVDFIDVYYGTWHWPAFNVADAAISVGAVMLVVSALRGNPVPGGH